MNSTIVRFENCTLDDFTSSPYERQKEIVNHWRIWGNSLSTPFWAERILTAIKHNDPLILLIVPGADEFYWKYAKDQQEEPDYSKANIDFDRANNSLIVDIEGDVYFAELTPDQYKQHVISQGKEGLDWQRAEGEIKLIDTPYEQQWLRAMLSDSILSPNKIEI